MVTTRLQYIKDSEAPSG